MGASRWDFKGVWGAFERVSGGLVACFVFLSEWGLKWVLGFSVRVAGCRGI